jgi:glutaconate CoA-transferase subunit A
MDLAVQKYIKDRGSLLLGGFPMTRCPVSFCKEILRQKKLGKITLNDLFLISPGIGFGGDLLVAAGVVDAIASTFSSHERIGLSQVVRNALEKGIPRKIKWEDESNLSLNFKVMAGALNLPYMPSNSGLWGDLRKPGLWDGRYSYPKNIIHEDPYGSGKKVALLQAIFPDVSVVHVPFADIHGNGVVLGGLYYDFWTGRCGKNIILVADRIVDIEMNRQFPNMVTVPGAFVSAVIPWYMDAWPTNTVGIHGEDIEHMKNYNKTSKQQNTMAEYLEKYVYSWKDHAEFLKLIGDDTVKALENNPTLKLAEPFKQWVYSQDKVEQLLKEALKA